MTPTEKQWLCQQADLTIPSTSSVQVRTKKGLIRRYGLMKNWFKSRNWDIYMDSTKTFHSTSGRPELLDDEALLLIGRQLVEKEGNLDRIPKTQLKKLIKQEIDASQVRRGMEPTTKKSISEDQFQRFKAKHSVTSQAPDLNTTARIIACFCPRLAFAFYLVCYVIYGHLEPMCKWNTDCTTYVFEPLGAGDKVCALSRKSDLLDRIREVDGPEPDDVLPQSTSRGSKTRSISTGLPFAIKVQTLNNAQGDMGPAVLIVAVKSFPEGRWLCEEVTSLSFTSELGQKGYLYFAKTRCGTKEMWKDIFVRVIFPFIKKSNEYYKPKKVFN